MIFIKRVARLMKPTEFYVCREEVANRMAIIRTTKKGISISLEAPDGNPQKTKDRISVDGAEIKIDLLPSKN